MCGHVGIAGLLEVKDEKLMKRLLIQDYFRGPDSTGFAALRKDGSHKISKISSHPIDLFQMKTFVDALQGFSSSVFLGHNRFATKGLVNTYNAHPYEFDHIVGAHNGTLDKSSWGELHKLLDTEYPVDSMAIIAAIAKVGIEETVNRLRGAWALVWFDKKEGTLNFLRNDQRTFWYAYNEKLTKIFWASEHPMIKAANQLGDPKDVQLIWKTKKDNYGYFATDTDVLYRIDLNLLLKSELDVDVQPDFRVRDDKGHVKSYAGKEAEPAKSYQAPFMGSQNGSHGSTASSSTKKSPSEAGNVIHLRGTSFDPLAGVVDRATFEEFAKYGCSWCQADVDYNEPGITVYPELQSIRCSDCSGNSNHNKVYLMPHEFNKVQENKKAGAR